MIDFKNKGTFKLKKDPSYAKRVEGLLIDGEEVIDSFKSMRDGVVFTNIRIIACNVQGITGSKVDYSSIPYSKINLYSVETAGSWEKLKLLGADAELEIYLSGHGKLKFEFKKDVDIQAISKLITQYIVK